MSALKDGGPAFPGVGFSSDKAFPSQQIPHQVKGMSLRDYFAAKAMQGFCANQACNPVKQEHFDNLAADAYRTADAMLKARNEGSAA